MQNVFEALEKNGLLQLRVVTSLTQGDLDIAEFAPEFTFVQSRLSGLSADIVLRHLKKFLPPETNTVLLAVDADDAAQARKQGKAYLDLLVEDEVLSDGITGVLLGEPLPATKKGAAAPGPVRKPKAVREPAPVTPEQGPEGEAEPIQQPAAEKPGAEELPPVEEPAAEELPPAEAPVGEQPPVQEPPAPRETAAPQKGAAPQPAARKEAARKEAARKEAARKETAAPRREVSEQGEPAQAPGGERPGKGGASFEELMRAAAEKEAEEQLKGVSVPLPVLKTKKHPLWTIPLILLLILAPLFYFLGPQKATPTRPLESRQAPASGAAKVVPERRPPAPAPPSPGRPVAKAAPQPTPGTAPAVQPARPAAPQPAPGAVPHAPVRPVQPQVAPLHPAPPAPAGKVAPPRPAAPQAAKPAPAKPPLPVPAQVPQPAAKGLTALPSFLAGVKMDPLYARTHPGWQRYIGARAEYKIFKEGDLFKAIQVIALPGQTVPDEIFRKVLAEFGAIEAYRVKSTETKQHYLVDHCVTNKNLGLTIYRKISDHRMKGFVLFYQ